MSELVNIQTPKQVKDYILKEKNISTKKFEEKMMEKDDFDRMLVDD